MAIRADVRRRRNLNNIVAFIWRMRDQSGPIDILLSRWTLDNSPAWIAVDMMSRVFSPYDLILSVWNPLRNILKAGVDFERSAKSPIKLFITATNVATGRARVFRNRDITPDVLHMIALLRQVADPGRQEWEKWSKMRVHYVPNQVMTQLSASSKLIAEWDFFCLLRDRGRHTAQAFLKRYVDDLGRRSTLDLDVLLKGV
jgi:hypothetical protein